MIGDCRAYCQRFVDPGGGGRGYARLLQLDHDARIQPVRPSASITKTNNIELHRSQELEFRCLRYALLQVTRQLAGPCDGLAQRIQAVDLQCEPRLQRSESA